MQNIAERASDAWLKTVDMGLVVQCAKEAPDSAVRNAALTLLAVLATKLPDSALQHVLEVCHFCMNEASVVGISLIVVFTQTDILQPKPLATHYRCNPL